MGAIFWEKGKIFGNLGKKVQNWKIFWKKAGHCIWEIACNKLLEKVLLELDLTLIKWHIFAESWSNFLGCYDGVTAISLYITINVNKITSHFFNFDKVTLAIFEQVKKCPLVFLLTLLRSLLQFSLKWASNVFSAWKHTNIPIICGFLQYMYCPFQVLTLTSAVWFIWYSVHSPLLISLLLIALQVW